MGRGTGHLVWDLPTRVFHWWLTLSLVASWITAEAGFEWTQWHIYLGYCALGLVLFRLMWGVVGTRHARFGSFLRGPFQVIRYARTLPEASAPAYAGHNPLGGWMVILLLLLVAVQAVTGLFISDDVFFAGALQRSGKHRRGRSPSLYSPLELSGPAGRSGAAHRGGSLVLRT